jgi:outer membrane lipoprotein-sorting protein
MVVESQFIPSTIRISSIKLNEAIPDSYFDPNSKENKVIKE